MLLMSRGFDSVSWAFLYKLTLFLCVVLAIAACYIDHLNNFFID